VEHCGCYSVDDVGSRQCGAAESRPRRCACREEVMFGGIDMVDEIYADLKQEDYSVVMTYVSLYMRCLLKVF
jgi:hypothetical protein